MEDPYFCTSKATSHPRAASSSKRTEATHRFRLGSPFPAGRTAGLCASMSRELLSGQIQPWNLCKAAVTPRAWPVPRCVTSGSTGHLRIPFLFPWSLPGFAMHLSWYHCSFPAGFCVCGQAPSHVQTVHLRKEKCSVETREKESFGREMGCFVYLKLEPDSS